MKYYSEKLDKYFDSEKECKDAEKTLEANNSLKENEVKLIKKNIDDKLDAWKKLRDQEVETLIDLAQLTSDLIDVAPEEFFDALKVIKEIKDYEEGSYDKFSQGWLNTQHKDEVEEHDDFEYGNAKNNENEDFIKAVIDFLSK